MKNINEYTEMEVRTAYEGITTGLTLCVGQPIVIDNLLNALEEVKTRANELGIEL